MLFYNSIAWVCSILYLECNMGLHYLAFMGRYLEPKEKRTLVRKMNSAGMNSKNIVINVGISMMVLL